MKPAAFDYHRPDTIEGAVGLLAELGDLGDGAKILAGGQSLVPMLAMRLAYFDHLIDISRLSELQGIDRRGAELWIGAGTTEATVGANSQVSQAVPLLTRVTPFVGHFQIRNRGTLGGSIAHADAAGEYPAVALTLDAVMEVQSPRGRREIAAADFFAGVWETTMESDEVLTGVRFPVWNGRCGFAVEEFSRRHGDFAIAGALVAVQLDDEDRVSRCAIGLLGMGVHGPARDGGRGRGHRQAGRRAGARGDRPGRDDRARRHSQRPAGVGVVPVEGGRHHGHARLDTGDSRSSHGGKQCVNTQSNCPSTELRTRPASNRG